MHPLEIYSAELDGHPASEEDARRLSRWIAKDPAHAQAVVDLSLVHGMVDEHLSVSRLLDQLASSRDPALHRSIERSLADIEAASPSSIPPSQVAERSPSVGWVTWLAMAAGLLVGVGLFALQRGKDLDVVEVAPPPLPRENIPPPPLIADPPPMVATVTVALDARWSVAGDSSSNSDLPQAGSAIRAGDLVTLHEGIVQLANSQGSIVVVEGPAEFVVPDERSIRLTQGRLTAQVIRQRGNFRIETPTALVLDLGTEFGVGVDADGATDVSVYDGAVELSARQDALSPPTDQKRVIEAGKTGYVDPHGQLSYAVALVPHGRDFVRPDEVALRAEARAGSRKARQLARFYQLQRVEGLLAYHANDLAPASHGLRLGTADPPVRRETNSDSEGEALEDTNPKGAMRIGPEVGVILDFDTTTTSPFARGGLLDHRENIGRSGGELWLCWSTQEPPRHGGGLGVSLMFGDERRTQEPLFIGFRSSTEPPVLVANIGSHSIVQALSNPPGSSRQYWVVHLLLGERADVAAVWCASDLQDVDPTRPHAEIRNANIAFDRLLFSSVHRDHDLLVNEVIVTDRLEAIRQVHDLASNEE